MNWPPRGSARPNQKERQRMRVTIAQEPPTMPKKNGMAGVGSKKKVTQDPSVRQWLEQGNDDAGPKAAPTKKTKTKEQQFSQLPFTPTN